MRFRKRDIRIVSYKRLCVASVLLTLLIADAYWVRTTSELVEAIRDQSTWPLRTAWNRWTIDTAPRPAIYLTEGRFSYVILEGFPPEYMQDFSIVIGKDGTVREVASIRRWNDPQAQESESTVHVQLWASRMPRRGPGFGFWAPTHIRTWCGPYLSTNDHLNDVQLDALVDSLVQLTSAAPFEPRVTAALSRSIVEDQADQTIYFPSGYLHNTLTLALLTTFLYTLASTPFAIRHALRREENSCHHCGYCLDDLTNSACPECGNRDANSPTGAIAPQTTT